MKYTAKDLRHDFPDDAACLNWLVEYLYPDGIHCKNCNKITPHHAMKTRKSYSCELCGHHVHPTAGTIFHKSSTPLTLWFEAIFIMTATRSGVSAKQLERTLGVTYKTAWRMFHQIRKMMGEDDNEPLKGTVEIDETYFHGDPNKNRRLQRKVKHSRRHHQAVFGMVERESGRAKAIHVEKAGKALVPIVMGAVATQANIYSDSYRPYRILYWKGYKHKSVNHMMGEYVRDDVHTQNIENLWSHMKRGIRGVYRHVDPKYLQAYVDEYAFRYSHRKDFEPMFWALMGKVSN